MESMIIELCTGRWLTLEHLRELLGREANTIRNQYLRPLVEAGRLRFLYPDQRNHPRQAYTSAQTQGPGHA